MHIFSTGIFILVNVFEKLGLRYLLEKKILVPKLKENSQILKEDLKFDGVPVRVYQPRYSSIGERKGVVFFCGGGVMYGSIGIAWLQSTDAPPHLMTASRQQFTF